jgi:hypothetical protein
MAKIKRNGQTLAAFLDQAEVSDAEVVEKVSTKSPTVRIPAKSAAPAPLKVDDDLMSALNPDLDDPDQNVSSTPDSVSFLYFHSNRSNYAAQAMSIRNNVQDGDAFIVDGDQMEYIGEDFRITILNSFKVFQEVDFDTGQTLDATLDESQKNRNENFKECSTALALVWYSKNKKSAIVPTISQFRGAMSKAVGDHLRALKISRKPAWIMQAPTEEEIALRQAVVQATEKMITCRVWSELEYSQIKSKSSGFKYGVLSVKPKPATPEIIQALQSAFTDDDFKTRFKDVQTRFSNNLDFFKKFDLDRENSDDAE